MNTVSSNRRTPLKGLGTIVLALFLVMAMWVPIFATHLMVSIQTGNQTVDGGTALSLLATSSDDVTTHAWTADPTVGTFMNAAIEDTTWTAPATTTDDQVVMLTLSVTDGEHTLTAAASTVMITVRGADPTVSIQTADQSVFGGDSIDLQATSADLNAPVTSYAWAADPAVGSFSPNATVEDVTWTAPGTTAVNQVVTLTLTVTDSNGNADADDDITARDSVTITVHRGPTDVRMETADQDVAGGTRVELDAESRSADVPGATRLWTATPNVGAFADPAAEDTTWTAPAAMADDQMIILTLTVTDSGGGGARASVTITVLNGPTVSIQTADQTVDGGASIGLQATSGNSGRGFTLTWAAATATADPPGVAVGMFSPSMAVEDPTWIAPAATAANQVVTLTLTASDGGTDNDVSDSVTITVRGTDPTVSIETAAQTVLGGASIGLQAMSEDVDTYAWTATAGTFSNATEEDTTWTAPGTTAANQVVTLTLTVTDSDDITASASVKITVPRGPTVSIQTRDQTVDGGTDLQLRASHRDPDGGGVTTAWTADPAVGMFSNMTVRDATWMAPARIPATQVVTLTLTVTDDNDTVEDPTDDAKAIASVTITVPGTDPTVSIQTEDQNVLGGASIRLQATSADSDGTIASYAWTALPDEGTFSDAAVEDATWTAPATTATDQAVVLTLTVTASDSGSAMASVTITVPSGPLVMIDTVDQTVDGGTVLKLLATSRSADIPGATRRWTATAGTFVDPAVEDTIWTAPRTTAANQVVTLTLTVTASDGATGSDSVTITVRGTNPTVSIETTDQTVDGGASIDLLAMSADSGGTIDTYAWTATAGTFSNATEEDTTWTAPGTTAVNQVVTLTLTVTDSDGATARARVTITVPSGPTVSIQTADQTVFGGTVLQLLATSRDSDGSPVATHAWAADPNVGTFSNATEENTTWTAPAATMDDQVVTLTLLVTDNSVDAITGSDSVTITVPSTAPTVSIQTAEQTVDGGAVLQLEATSADSNGTIATYAWTAVPDEGTFSNAEVEDATWTAPATTMDDQVVTLTLLVTDNDSATDDADVMITVRGIDPTVSIETEDQTVDGGAPIDLLAMSEDVDTHAWTATAGTFSDATDKDTTWTAPAATRATQVVTLTLTVTDNNGAADAITASDSVTMTVPGTDPTVSIETTDQTVDRGAVLQLEATSADSKGTIATYAWTADPDEGTFSNAAVEDATWTAPATTMDDQVVTLTLTVTDNDGVTASDDVMITVPGTDPTVSIQTEDQDVAGGTVLPLLATSSDDVAEYAWTSDPEVGTFSDAAVEDATWTAPAATTDDQVVTLTLTVTDNDGVTASDDGVTASDDVMITVPGTDPTVSIQTEDQDVAGGTVLPLLATSSDDVAEYAWTSDPAVGTFSDAAVEDATWTAPAATMDDQVVTLTLTVTDNDGVTASDDVMITVPGTDPTVSIQTEDQDVAGGTVLPLLATSSGDVAEYAWTADPAVGTFSDAAVEDATWTAPATTTDDQVVTLTLTVTDNDGVTASDDVMITVPGADPTVSIQTEDQDVAGGTVLPLLATSSDDVAEYAWTADPAVGTFSDAAVEDATWTAPATTTDDQVVTLTLTVTDNDDATATASDDVTITVPGTVTVPGVSGGPVLSSVRVDDGPSHDGTGNDSRGNNDGIAQSGETIELYVSIRNDGELPLTGLSGELIETDPWVRVLYNASSGYPDVAAGAIQENRFDWDLRVSPDAPNGHEFSFMIRLTADEGGPWEVPVTVPIGGASPPGVPVLSSVRVDDGPSHDGTGNDSRGNNDGIAQCGETIELYVSIGNDGELPLTGLSGELIETDPWVRVLYNASSRYPDVAAGAIQENRFDWDLRVSPDALNGHEFSFMIRLTADEGGPWDVPVTVPIACG